MKTSRIAAVIILTAATVCLFYGASHAYDVPDTASSKMIFEEKQVVRDREPNTEILITTYVKPDGKLFRVYSVKDKVFRYDMDEDGAAPYEYRLMDNDGDGVFETSERLVGEMVIKDKGQRYFIDLGPEPGKEYRYRYEQEAGEQTMRQQAQILQGLSIYIPAWVLVEF